MGSPSKPKTSAAQKELERYQLEDIRRLRSREKQRGEAGRRGRLGRSSLLTGSARGVVEGETRKLKDTGREPDVITEAMKDPYYGAGGPPVGGGLLGRARTKGKSQKKGAIRTAGNRSLLGA